MAKFISLRIYVRIFDVKLASIFSIIFVCLCNSVLAISPCKNDCSTLERKLAINLNYISLYQIEKCFGNDTLYNDDRLFPSNLLTFEFKPFGNDKILEKCEIIEVKKYNYIHLNHHAIDVKNNFFVDSLIKISGFIVNEAGDPIPGATVLVKGTKLGAKTDEQGYFFIPYTQKKSIIIISSIGFTTVEMNALQVVNDRKIVLNTFIDLMDEKIVTAYKTTTARTNVGGGIGVVRAKDIEKMPVLNSLLTLQGNVAGVVVEQISGLSNSAVKVRVRGQISMGNGNEPLYVVDGVPYTSQTLPTNTTVLGYDATGQYSSPLSFINPADIESISVLKDADATSIYGSRAAAGAILITTKKGVDGPTRISFNIQNGWGKMPRRLNLMQSIQYMQMRHEAKYNAGASILPTDYDLNGTWDTTRNINWQDELLGGTALYSDYQLSTSGGNSNIQFLIGVGYHKETSVFHGKFDDQRGTLHFNIGNNSTNQKYRILLSGSYLFDNNRVPTKDFTIDAMTLAPVAPNPFNKDGSINWELNSNGLATWTNPLAALNNKSQIKTYNLLTNLQLSYQITPSLSIKLSSGYNNLSNNENGLFPLTSAAPQIRKYLERSSVFNYSNINSWILEPQLNYDINLNNGKVEILVGSSIQQKNSKQQSISASGFSDDLVMEDVMAAATIKGSNSIVATYRYNALFGNVNYNINKKYLFNFSARRDGSSRFGSQNQFHDFWSLAGAWVFTNEKFFETKCRFLTFGKLRASYGTTGNDQIGDYSFLSLYSQYPVNIPYQGAVGVTINTLSNPYLKWEETNKLQFGLDVGIFKDQRILINLDYFRNRSSNQLLNYTLPVMTGFTSVLRNFPATIQNTGFELTVNSQNVLSQEFSWMTSLNITIPRNKLVAFPNLSSSSYATTYYIGEPVTITPAYHFVGVDPETGYYQFSDNHGNAIPNPDYGADAKVLINMLPKFYGGLKNSFTYKGFQLDILFQFTKQIGQGLDFGNYYPGRFNMNQPVSLLEGRWMNKGDENRTKQMFSSTPVDGVGTGWFSAVLSDKAYIDGSFVRLKNVSLSYQLNSKWLQKIHLNSCRLYLHGQNLLTFTKYNQLDPETRNSSSLPPLRVITAGLQVSL